MTAHKDTQREHDINQQRAYGENPDAQEKGLGEQDVTTAAGVKEGELSETLDHGYLRDETGRSPVVSTDDELHPNVPDTMGADHGSIEPEAETPDLQEGAQILEDAYSRNDPGVETKS